MTPKTGWWLRVVAAGLLVCVLAGCVSWQDRQRGQGTSVMQFLYPSGQGPAVAAVPPVPELPLPLRVGVAFVPSADGGRGYYGPGGPTEQEKAALVAKVAERFRALPFIAKVEHIPTAYLRPGGGFTNLDQVSAMFGVDVVALIAYDQVQFTDKNTLSLAYWTIVGAYIVSGDHNDTQTLMDAVVYDVRTRTLLFRAPGTSRIQANSTAVKLETQMRENSARGFVLATDEMVKNLDAELTSFRTRIKERPEQVRITHRPGYSGAGDFGAAWALAFAGVLGVARWLERRARG